MRWAWSESSLNPILVMNTLTDSQGTEENLDAAPVDQQTAEFAKVAGLGIVGGGAAGAVIGGAVAGPVGALFGAVIGAVAGGAGSGAAVAEAGEPKHYEPLIVPATHEEIALRAWKYFEAEGRTDGHDFDDWVRAERDLYHDALAARDNLPSATAGSGAAREVIKVE
jgi:hypothetical protein